jgi:23S rRNA (adenine2503-C2)-methyltransferase
VSGFEEMTNLSKEARTLLSECFTIDSLKILERHRSPTDGSTKYLLQLADGKTVESVLMPIENKSGKRTTICISSQVGCAMGCEFCRTAEMKLMRNLSQGEILGQILAVQDDMASKFNSDRASAGSDSLRPDDRSERSHAERTDEGHGGRAVSPHISNVVMMGMGEPLHNYDNVIGSIRLMVDDFAIGISQRKITVSTVGLAPEIERFGKDVKVKLALSLNATTEEGRLKLMPITKKYPLDAVIEACKNYTRGSKHKVTFEYVMLSGINDTPDDMKRLAQIASHVPNKINLIPYNEYPGSPYKRPPNETLMKFFDYLTQRHFQVNIRYSKGLDVLAACGQLATAANIPDL